MSTIQVNSLNEMQKLLARRITKLFLIAALLIPVLTKLLVNNLFIADWMILPTENINFTLLDLFVTILLPIFIFISATDLFTGESERGTLFQVRPISRIELFISKTSAIALFTLLILVLLWLSVMISSVILDKAFDFNSIFSSLGAFIASWFPIIVISTLAVMMAQMVNSSILAISSMIILYLIMMFIPYILPGTLYLLPSTYLDWYMQWLGNVSIRWVIQTVTYLCSSFTLFFSAGYYMFNRKET